MICHYCKYDIKEGHEFFDEDLPSNAYHEDCYDIAFCDCGRKVWENGLCLDCSSDAEGGNR